MSPGMVTGRSIVRLARRVASDPPADEIARQVRLILRDQGTPLDPDTEHVTEIIATELIRHATHPGNQVEATRRSGLKAEPMTRSRRHAGHAEPVDMRGSEQRKFGQIKHACSAIRRRRYGPRRVAVVAGCGSRFRISVRVAGCAWLLPARPSRPAAR